MDEIKEIEGMYEDGNYEKTPPDRRFQILFSKIKELEDNIPDPEWCCEKHKAGLVLRIKELKDGIEKYLNDPEFDTDILTKLIEKENKDG